MGDWSRQHATVTGVSGIDMQILIEVIGWAGAVLLLLAYGLVSAGKVASDSASYQAMNLLGAAGLVVNSGWNGAFPSASLNIIWMAIGLVALIRSGLRPTGQTR
jgi:hypothetical protein